MKKTSVYVLLMWCFLISNVFASTTTYERTLEDLKISPDIKVNEYNKHEILNTPKVEESEKVYDFAELFSSYEEELIYNNIINFISNSDLDMVVVTIDNNPKNSAMAYADDFYDYNYFGKGTTHDGILFLIDMDTREMWISTTGKAILIYDDYRIDKILDSTYDKIVDQEYYECAKAFINKSQYYFNLGIPDSNKNANINTDGDYVYNYDEDVEFDGFFIFVALIIALIVVFIMKGRHKTIRKATTAVAYMNEKSITYRRDDFITSNTIKTYDPPSSSSSGGGSSSHRSSSGRSHGGGGRRF